MTEDLLARYQGMANERGKLHRLSFENDDENAARVLDLIELPFDDLVGIAKQLSSQVSNDRRQAIAQVVARSPIAHQHQLIAWLHDNVNCPEVGWFLTGADFLRHLLLETLSDYDVRYLERQPA